MDPTNATCDHEPIRVGRIVITACAVCQRVDWSSEDGPVDHTEAMASVFGAFDLEGSLDALGAPAPRVLVCVPPGREERRRLDLLPRGVWLYAGLHVWLAHDGEHLLLAITDRLPLNNVTRGA